MPSLRPLRAIGPTIIAFCVALGILLEPPSAPLVGTQFAFLAVGGILVTTAAYRNPIRTQLGWRPLLGLGEVAVGVSVPLGVLGTGVADGPSTIYATVSAVAAFALFILIGSQVLEFSS